MKILKLKPTIDEWGRSVAAKGLAEGFCVHWKNYPKEIQQNISFITAGRELTPGDVEHNSYLRALFQTAVTELKNTVKESETEPVLLSIPWTKYPGYIWFFKGYIYHVQYSDNEQNYSHEQTQLLIYESFDSERRKFERLRQLYKDNDSGQSSYHRERIPERVRIEVWRRDGGKCARCGSREKLEYDHIVPISKGGSNTARNIELLCETCNRKKSDNVV